MKKNIYKILILTLLNIPEIVMASEYIKCGNDNYFPLALATLTSTFFTIIKILIPIFLVISGMISFLKVTFSSNVDDDLKKAKSKLINDIIAAIIIFFVISIISFAVGLVAGANNKFINCINCFINPEKCEHIEKDDDINPSFINESSNNNKTEATKDKTLNDFLFIGDSRYVGIEQQLKELGSNIKVEATIGSGPSNWIDKVKDFVGSYNKISIMLGVNETNSDQMINLLNKIHELNANSKIYVNSVYHIGTAYKSGYVNNTTIDTYNNKIKEYCSKYDWLIYIDITNGLYDNNGNLNSTYTSDGLHMNTNGNNILIENIKKELTK